MKLNFIFFVVALALSGCASMSESMQANGGVGSIDQSTSGFDGEKEIIMKNAWVANDAGGMAQIGMAFRWRSSSPAHVGIIVRVFSMSDYNNIGGAALNIDGSIEKLVPVEALTSHENTQITNTTCSLAYGCTKGISFKNSDKMFVADFSLVQRMVTAEALKIRVDGGRDYQVGDLRKDSFGNIDVQDKLPEFVASVQAARGEQLPPNKSL